MKNNNKLGKSLRKIPEKHFMVASLMIFFLFACVINSDARVGYRNAFGKTVSNDVSGIEESLSVDQVVQQKRSVTGKVTDINNLPLPGVTVVVKGTTRGTAIDSNGEFELDEIPEDGILVFSFVGMITQEIAVRGLRTINVKLNEDAIGLQEVVAIGFGLSQKKETLTGAVSVIGSEEITRSNSSTASGEFQVELLN